MEEKEAAALPHIAQQALVSALLGMYNREVYPCEKEKIYNLLYNELLYIKHHFQNCYPMIILLIIVE